MFEQSLNDQVLGCDVGGHHQYPFGGYLEGKFIDGNQAI
jgi:hypothetical protein